MPYRTINDTLLAYQEQGAGEPLVLIHGFPLDWRIFERQVSALSEKFRVIAPDLPGFGQSKSEQPFSIESLADDLHALLASLKALPCALGGLSMGGYVALAFAKKYPRDLSALILIDTRSEADTQEAKAGRDKMIELVRKSGPKAVAEQMLPKMLAPETLAHSPAVAANLRQIMEQCPAKTIEHALVAMRDREDYSSMLGSIAVPVLIVVGEHDAITPLKMSEAMRDKIADAQLVQIAGAGHLSTMEKPEEASAAIREFLSDALNKGD